MAQPTHKEEISTPKISHGRGSYLTDVNGKTYIDGSGGPAVFCIGHGNEEVNAAIIAQLSRIAQGYRQTFSSDPLEELTEIVARRCGGTLRHMIFNTGGSEAVESCLKVALQYHYAKGEPRRKKFISRERSWHGNTLGALGVSGFLERQVAYEFATVPAIRLSPVNAYRPIPGATSETLAAIAAAELEAAIIENGPENIAAFIFEPVVGAAGGCVPAPAIYAKKIRDICSRHGVLMISDEVMCGAGRTGHWRALEADGAMPDIMAVAKGLAAGYLPLGATIYSDEVSAAINHAPQTGHTFTAHTACLAAGVAVQKIVTREKLVERVRENEALLKSMLQTSFGGIAEVGDIRGRGYFMGIELVADRKSKVPFPATLQLHHKVRLQALENGLICYPMGGNVDGINGDTIIVAPPYNSTKEELSEICEKLGTSIRQVLEKTSRLGSSAG